jgi:glycosyltransferase involved in cell wall biosynthesis
MRIVWVTWFFLDYRIPVFEELSKLDGVEFYLLYNSDIKYGNINEKIRAALNESVIPMTGEVNLSYKSFSGFSNKGFRIPFQPGLIKKINQLKPDVLISDGFFQWTYAPLIVRATKGTPHVMCYEKTAHTERNAQRFRRAYRKFVMRWIDAICCSGRLCGDYVSSLGFDGTRINFGHMVADTYVLQQKAGDYTIQEKDILRNKLKLSGTVYLYVGRMHEMKGIMQLLKAWSTFTSDLVNKPSLLLVGSGDLDEQIKAEIKNQKLDTVIFSGRVNYDEIADYYQIADIFIIPTLEDNWSLVVPEAMASGLPIITSRYNGCWPELVQKSNGWVMDPLNHKNFVDTLSESYNAKDRFTEMGKSSVEIISHYTPLSAALSIYEACNIALCSRQNNLQ